jgi:hypothetical protein
MYLEKDDLYKMIEDPQRDNYAIYETVKLMFDTEPNALHKTLNYLNMQAEMLKQEKLRISKLQKEKEESHELIKNAIKKIMLEKRNSGHKNYIDTEIGKISIRKSPGKLNIISLEDIPEEYFKIEKTPKLNDLKSAYKNGSLKEGIVEITTDYSVVIK